MCGRFTLTADPAALHAEFGINDLPPDYRPRYNVAPTQPVLSILAADQGWSARYLVWGLIPHWSRDRTGAAKRINARAESLLEKPSFREAFERRRCLVIADGFYEWEKAGSFSRPVLARRRDGRVFTFAGIWERWSESPGSTLDTCAIVTTEANRLLGRVHDRMPVIIAARDREDWLSGETPRAQLLGLLKPAPDDALEYFPVSSLVNSPANDSPDCIQPA